MHDLRRRAHADATWRCKFRRRATAWPACKRVRRRKEASGRGAFGSRRRLKREDEDLVGNL